MATQSKKDDWYRRTEKMLYTYPSLDDAIKHLEAVLRFIDRNKVPSNIAKYGDYGPPGTADKMSEPEAYADKRIRAYERVNRKLELLRTRKAAIEKALDRLSEDNRRLVELWYFENWRLSKKGKGRPIWKELGISRNTFLRRRNEIVEEVARWLGELVSIE